MSREVLLLLGGRAMQLPAIRAAHDLGLRVVVVDPDPYAIGRGHADQFHVVDLSDRAACLDIARREQAQGVLTLAADYPVPVLAFLCQELGLAGLSPAAARAATNKREMRRAFERAGVPSPRSIPADSLAEAGSAIEQLGGRVIVKPTSSSGGRGVTSLPFAAGTDQIRHAYERAMGETRENGVLVEELVEGPEFSVESLTAAGVTSVVAVTDKITTEAPFYAEIGHTVPTVSAADVSDSVSSVAREAIAALAINDAGTHTEIRVGADGPKVIEVGARLAGGYIASHLVPLATGVDLLRAAIHLAMGRQVDLTPRWTRGAGIRFFMPNPGRVKCVTGLEKARRIPGVRLVSVEVGPGDLIRPLRDSRDRVGYVISDGQDARSAAASAQEAARLVCFKTEQEDGGLGDSDF